MYSTCLPPPSLQARGTLYVVTLTKNRSRGQDYRNKSVLAHWKSIVHHACTQFRRMSLGLVSRSAIQTLPLVVGIVGIIMRRNCSNIDTLDIKYQSGYYRLSSDSLLDWPFCWATYILA